MPSRNRTPRYVVFALTGLIVSLIAVGVDGAPSRLRAALSKPESTPQASLARDGEDFMRVAELRPVHFGTAKAGTRSADAVVLEADAAWLKANPTHPIRVAGYADERGTKQYNLALAERRAESVRDQLVARGVQADRISIVAFGEGRPCNPLTASCLAENRRVDILVARPVDQRP